MPNTGGLGGSVTKIATTATGSTVFVHFPGPPEKDESYDVADPFLRRFENGKPPSTVDVSCDPASTPPGAVNGVTTKP